MVTLKCSPYSTAPTAPVIARRTQRPTIDHIAFEIALAHVADERKRLEALGLQAETAKQAWLHWRSLYVTDPEGNQIELVCFDASV